MRERRRGGGEEGEEKRERRRGENVWLEDECRPGGRTILRIASSSAVSMLLVMTCVDATSHMLPVIC